MQGTGEYCLGIADIHFEEHVREVLGPEVFTMENFWKYDCDHNAGKENTKLSYEEIERLRNVEKSSRRHGDIKVTESSFIFESLG